MKWRICGMTLGVALLLWVTIDAAGRIYANRQASALILQLLEKDSGRKSDALEQLRKMGPSAAPAVAAMLRHEDIPHRRAALLACGQVVADCLDRFSIMNCIIGIVPERWGAERGFKIVGRALAVALNDGDEDVRLGAAGLVIKIPQSEMENPTATTGRALAVLGSVLGGHSDPKTRLTVIETMAGAKPIRYLEGISSLIGATGDQDEDVRRAALNTLVESLARDGSPVEKEARSRLKSAIPMILSATKTRPKAEERYIHFGALIQLGMIGEPSAITPLIDDLGDVDQEMRSGAAAALSRFGYLFSYSEEDPINSDRVIEEIRKAIPKLIVCLKDPNFDVRRHAGNALGSMGASALQAIPALQAAAEKESNQNARYWLMETIQGITKSAEIDRLKRSAAPTDGRTPPL